MLLGGASSHAVKYGFKTLGSTNSGFNKLVEGEWRKCEFVESKVVESKFVEIEVCSTRASTVLLPRPHITEVNSPFHLSHKL